MAETSPSQPRIMPECVASFLATAGMLRDHVRQGAEPSGTYAGSCLARVLHEGMPLLEG
jgi:hypothetical protein